MRERLPFTQMINDQLSKEIQKQKEDGRGGKAASEQSQAALPCTAASAVKQPERPHHSARGGERSAKKLSYSASQKSESKASYVDHNRDIARQKIRISLVALDRVSIKPSNRAIAIVMSRIPNSFYDFKNNEWFFSPDHYQRVVSELGRAGVVAETIPAGTIKMACRKIPDERPALTGNVFDSLMKFQREAVYFAINREGRVLLSDDMGLGKTIQAIAIAHYYSSDFPLLIISPASLIGSWTEAVERFMNITPCLIRSRPITTTRPGVYIISYSHATSLHSDIIQLSPGVVICDECHYLKSMTSKRTQHIVPILQGARRLVMVSGTPALSRPLELFPIFKALDKSIFPHFAAYGMRYCSGKRTGRFYDYRGCSNAGELGVALEHAFMIRRTKASVMSELPAKFRRQVVINCPKSAAPSKSGSRSKANMLGLSGALIMDDGGESELDSAAAAVPGAVDGAQEATVITEFANAAKKKKEPVVEYIGMVLERKMKLVVFAHHQEMLNGIEEYCREKKHRYIRIDGTTPSAKRHGLVEEFQHNESILVAILSITSCSAGITLTAAQILVFAELYWNPGTLLQAEDRIHRIGQKSSVDIHYLVAKNTIDEFVWPQILKKLNVLESLGIGKNELKFVKSEEEKDSRQQRLDGFFGR